MLRPLYCCPDYKVSNDGYVMSKIYNRPLKPSTNKSGYQLVNLTINGKSKTVQVHKAVAMAFVPGYQDGLQVNHKDGDKKNNKSTNLEWLTAKENMRHSVDVLHNYIGANNSRAKGIIGIDKETGVEKYRFDSISDAARFFCDDESIKNVKNSIWRVLRGKRKSYKGLIWVYQ